MPEPLRPMRACAHARGTPVIGTRDSDTPDPCWARQSGTDGASQHIRSRPKHARRAKQSAGYFISRGLHRHTRHSRHRRTRLWQQRSPVCMIRRARRLASHRAESRSQDRRVQKRQWPIPKRRGAAERARHWHGNRQGGQAVSDHPIVRRSETQKVRDHLRFRAATCSFAYWMRRDGGGAFRPRPLASGSLWGLDCFGASGGRTRLLGMRSGCFQILLDAAAVIAEPLHASQRRVQGRP